MGTIKNTLKLSALYVEEKQIQRFINQIDSPEKFGKFMFNLRKVRNGLGDILEKNQQADNSPMMEMFRTLNQLYGDLLFDDMTKNTHLDKGRLIFGDAYNQGTWKAYHKHC